MTTQKQIANDEIRRPGQKLHEYVARTAANEIFLFAGDWDERNEQSPEWFYAAHADAFFPICASQMVEDGLDRETVAHFLVSAAHELLNDNGKGLSWDDASNVVLKMATDLQDMLTFDDEG